MTGAAVRRAREQGVRGLLFLAALLSVATTAGIIAVLAEEAGPFFGEVGLLEFLGGTTWTPLFDPPSFGVLPLVFGTFLVAAMASALAVPVGLGCAFYLSEHASPRVAAWLKPVLEILAGVPTVVYGYFAVTSVTPLLQKILPATQVFNALSASIVVGVMILPMIASLCDDAFRAVPASLREAGYALGGTPFEVSTQVVLPAALSGVLASVVLALSRAVGETMAVALAAGSRPQITANPLEPVETLTAYIVQVSLGDTPAGTREYRSLYAVAAVLFVITLGMNLGGRRILRRFREEYG